MPEELTINEQKKNMSVSGTVDSVIYSSEETGYTVCLLESEGECVTVVGTLPYLTEGDRITAYGSFVNHPVYGVQFKCEFFERVMPETKGDILRYLSSGAVKGIGPKTASRIVDKFGEDSFDVIENHPDWLAEINGISQKKAAVISQSFREMAGARDVIMFCRNLCSGATAMRIYKKWGRDSVGKIRENPYRLCSEFHGIGFRRADEIALTIGTDKNSPERLSAGISYVLSAYMQKTGNTLMAEGELIDTSSSLLDVPAEILAPVLDDEVKRSHAVGTVSNGERYISLPRAAEAEKY